MRVRELVPEDFGGFIKREVRACRVGAEGCSTVSPHDSHEYHVMTPSISEAEGLWIYCPKCFAAKGGTAGVHGVICWRPSVPQTVRPIPGRWEFVGTSLDDLSLVAGSSSIQLVGGCNAHFWIRNGNVEDLT